MNSPKEKAIELFNKYDNYPLTYEWKKQCALIAVDEMYDIAAENNNVQQVNYLVDVKQEIEKL
jgi:hypothetical protein